MMGKGLPMKGFFGFKLTTYDSDYYRIYDRARQVPLARIPSFRALRALLDLKPGETLLDAGCGAGHQLDFYLAGSGATGAGVDHSEAALHEASTHFPALRLSRQDIRCLALEDACIDKIVCFNVIEHLCAGDQELAMDEFWRVLKPAGSLVIGTNIRNSLAWKLYQAFIGEHTHLREFTAGEFKDFVASRFTVDACLKSSGVFRFGPPVDWIFHYLLLGDVIVRAHKSYEPGEKAAQGTHR